MRHWKKQLSALACLGVLTVGTMGCESTSDTIRRNPKATAGTVGGAATGALIGGVIGHQSDNTGTGALIGGATGAAVGGVVGHEMDRQDRRR